MDQVPVDRDADRAAVRLQPDAAEIRLVERALAVTRTLLAIAAVFVAYVLPPTSRSEWAQELLVLYAVYAVILLIGIVGSSRLPRRMPLVVQALDVGYVAALAMVPIGDTVPFFSFLLFPLFTAGARWGFNEVMVTTAIVEAIIAVDGLFDRALLSTSFLAPRAVAIAAAGAAVGYLAEQQRRLRFEDRAIAVILGRARMSGTLGDTVNLVLASVRNVFKAKQVILVFVERPVGTPHVLLWSATAAPADQLEARPTQLPPNRHGDYLFEAPGDAWHAWRRPGDDRNFRVEALDALGRRLERATLTIPASFLADHPCHRLIGASLQLSDEWVCRLLVVAPDMHVHREQSARFALTLAQKVAPAIYNQYLVSRLRTRAQAIERSRIAREMHDGVTQSLLGLEMEIAVLRRRAKAEAPMLVDDLARIHGIVRDEVVTVRELMEGIRVDDVGAGDLVHHLSDVVDRFGRYTGIAARFVSDGKPAPLAGNVRRQMARIVHEALVNVRKHSGANRVLVRAHVDGGSWRVSVEDDGRGFPFGGTMRLDELEAHRYGPRTIGERAKMIGAELTVDSRPGAGSRVEVAVPLGTESVVPGA